MKKILLLLVLLPLVSFGDVPSVDVPVSVWKYAYPASGTSLTKPTMADVRATRIDISSVADYYFCWPSAVRCSSSGTLQYPGIPTSSSAYTNSVMNQDFCLQGTNGCWYSLAKFCPQVLDFAAIASRLVVLGYSGSGITNFHEVNNVYYFNMQPSAIFADIISGTNTVFRQILINHLSTISSSLSSIAPSVGTINTDYQTVNNLYLDHSKQTLLDSAANPSSLNANSSIAANLDRLYGSSYAGRESEITKALSDLARSQLQAAWLSTLDPDSPFYMQNLDTIISDPGTFQQAALQGGGGGGSALANIMRDVKKLSTNDWVSGVTNQLANNRASITNQLAHMFDDDTSAGFKLGNIQTSSALTASAAGSIDERLANGITVAVVNSGANSVLVSLDGPINIDQTQFNSLSVPLGSLQNTVSDWYSDWYDFFRNGSQYRWGDFVDYFLDFKSVNHSDISSLTNSLSSISSLSNLLVQIDQHLTNSLPNLTNLAIASSSFSALLLDHYEDYISNSVYASSISKLETDYPSVYSNLVDFGLSPSGDGDFWSLFGSSLIQLDLLADNFISDMALVRKFADDNIPGGFSAGISSIIEVMPKKEDIVSSASAASNIVSALDLSSTNLVSAFHSVTSRADSVFTPFRGTFETPPSDLVLFKTGNDKYITIPVHEHPEAFRLMRWGFSFALAAVNFIFFPKFVLMLVMLFSKLSQRFVKFYPSVKDE